MYYIGKRDRNFNCFLIKQVFSPFSEVTINTGTVDMLIKYKCEFPTLVVDYRYKRLLNVNFDSILSLLYILRVIFKEEK